MKHCSSSTSFYAILISSKQSGAFKQLRFFVLKLQGKGENVMKYIDDILYVLGWLCFVAVAFSYDLQLGGGVLGAGCFVTSWIFARYKARHGDRK